ncbi:alpha/beta hydrolase family protein [Candidatus Laterigemmans baculatus]|uniref:alpha/beta hydrolase family protein n=1 Tax=Candidatus Laterigemmans baculatus TaxID=2770505 RepID=UPI0013D9EA0F|nr:dienelactone hydrolase family protein [Candidatus Laterigemmans baculatus]
MPLSVLAVAVAMGPATVFAQSSETPERLPNTAPLVAEEPLIDRMLVGAERFLDAQLVATQQRRRAEWIERMQKPAAEREARLAELRERLQKMVGGDDSRVTAGLPQIVAPLGGPSELARGGGVVVHQVRWPVLDGYVAEGLAVTPEHRPGAPEGGAPQATVIWLPEADVRPETLVGLDGVAAGGSEDPAAGLPLQLAAAGCRVIVPQMISRRMEVRGGRAEITDREYVYRATFVLGRHPLGLEVQTVRAVVDGLRPEGASASDSPIAVAGHGEGGLVALLTGAIDPRVDVVLASGVWGNRDAMWSEPVSRNLFGLLSDFGDAPLAAMIGPRRLIIEAAQGPELEIATKSAAPGRLVSPTLEEVEEATAATRQIMGDACDWLTVIDPPGAGYGSTQALETLVESLGVTAKRIADRQSLRAPVAATSRGPFDAEAARAEQLRQIERLGDHWVRTSRKVRSGMIDELDTSSLEAYEAATAPLRERFERDVLGRFDQPLLPPAVRSRLWRRSDRWTGWEVEMDVFPELIAGGILLVPNDAPADEPRPVVVCVHGLEGTPEHTITEERAAYNHFAASLCERGFIVFCPQQPYTGGDRFRVLQRKANPLGKTLFSLIVPQHRQLVRWLQTLPQVDPERVAFYGLSYGGKSAMRIPAVVTEYGPTICSGDYNEWVLKNVSTSDRFSYVWTGEYEIFEFDLAGTFSYAEMAALICPRPFMVERGHFDGVAEDRWVGFEYAPVRYLYAARLKIPERTEIEWFPGPHAIFGKGSYEFLHRHLDWPEPAAAAR